MTPLSQKIEASRKTYRFIAEEISLAVGSKINGKDVHNFAFKHFDKIGSSRKKIIRKYFQSINWLATPAPKEKCLCPTCGRSHYKKVHRSNPAHSGGEGVA